MIHDVEYAGFRYQIQETPTGHFVLMVPPGQHPAASKEKHRRAALEIFMEKFTKRSSKNG